MGLEAPAEIDESASNGPDSGDQLLRCGTATEVTETHRYIYAGGKLLRETITEGSTTKTLDFTYDNVGMPYSLTYNNGSATATYYYITNLQGDVMYLVDANGNEVAAYDYDPYGKIISATGELAGINPLRYRGYYYDTETGFYYLQSRYYDPEICRFINADSYASTGQGFTGFNMFAYCNNNPVNFIDPYGHDAEALGWWVSTMPWLCAADGPIPIGDIIYAAGIVVLGIYALVTLESSSTTFPAEAFNEPTLTLDGDDEVKPEPPDVSYPGDDPAVPPEEGFEWRGQEPVGSDKCSWVNTQTGEQYHPDLNHGDPVGPHYDYTDGAKPRTWWRIFPDGRVDLRM